MSAYTPSTGTPCHCRKGIQRDNCPTCEGTGMQIDFAAIRARKNTACSPTNNAELLDKLNARTEHCAALILQRNKLAAALRSTAERAELNATEHDDETDAHEGFRAIANEARAILAELDTGGLPV